MLGRTRLIGEAGGASSRPVVYGLENESAIAEQLKAIPGIWAIHPFGPEVPVAEFSVWLKVYFYYTDLIPGNEEFEEWTQDRTAHRAVVSAVAGDPLSKGEFA